MRPVVEALFRGIPAGVGSRRKDLKLPVAELKKVLKKGVQWTLEQGYGSEHDRDLIEAHGCIPGADPQHVSDKALERGRAQLGTLGSGNHFVEMGYVDEVFDPSAAAAMGLAKDQMTVLIHTGSRGLGHQVCDDYIKIMMQASQKYNIALADRQLCCAPLDSREGKGYLSAMACAANFAFVNRQMITHWVRDALEQVFQLGPRDLQLGLVYDVCHNMARMETHVVDGKKKRLCVHRKGATRAFPPGHPEVPGRYRKVGQPVLIPGDMGRASYVLVGTEQGYNETFGSTCHGAGRLMSRRQAKKTARGRDIAREMEDKGIIVRGASRSTLVEEIPDAYKDVNDVVDVVHGAGIAKKVVRLKPLGVIKG